jgi:DNA transformation protein
LRGELYLKADETTAPRFVSEGSRPFSYTQPTSGKVVTVNSFWRLPERLYDDPDDLAEWARMAVAAAHRQKLGKRKRVQKPAASKRTRPAAKPAPRPARKRLKAKKAR